MNKNLVLICATLLAISGLALGYRELGKRKVQYVDFEKLFASPDQYNDRNIVIEGFLFHGFEIIVLCERLEHSGLAEGHLVPKGRMIWIEGGIPPNIHDALHIQQMMGPEERYGKIRIKGKYESEGKYGHLGIYNYQIKPTEVELLQWSP